MKNSINVLLLATDAYGGFGGISQYNRDLCQSLSSLPQVSEIHTIVRAANQVTETIPNKVKLNMSGIGGIHKFTYTVLLKGLFGRRPGIVICAHINLLPLAWIVARIRRVPLILLVFGIDVWKPTPKRISNILAEHCDCIVAISQVTLRRFQKWCYIPEDKTVIWPNPIDISYFQNSLTANVSRSSLGIEGKTVLMTLGRMVGKGRAKGFDEILDLLPTLIAEIPDIVYIAAGSGPDIERLKSKSMQLGISEYVIFPGKVSDAEKIDLYKLSDIFVMPSHGEGFGYVILEALACGTPVVASSKDGGYEAIREGLLGEVVDPDSINDIKRGIIKALGKPRGVPKGLDFFSFHAHSQRISNTIDRLITSNSHKAKP